MLLPRTGTGSWTLPRPGNWDWTLTLHSWRKNGPFWTADRNCREQAVKERALAAVELLQEAADRRGVRLKLNKKPKKG